MQQLPDAERVQGQATHGGHDLDTAVQGNSSWFVADGISLFTYGKAQGGGKPNQESGIRRHVVSGKLDTQSRTDKTQLTP